MRCISWSYFDAKVGIFGMRLLTPLSRAIVGPFPDWIKPQQPTIFGRFDETSALESVSLC